MANLSYTNTDDFDFAPGVSFLRKTICWCLPILYLLISDTFYLRTYDSAQVKITLLQMGGFSLLGMWLSLLILEGKRAFYKADFVMLAPFFAYLFYVILSFINAPYKGPSVDDFVRYILYMTIPIIVIREFAQKDIDRLTKILIITGYISIIYGFIQFLDTRLFPVGMGGGGLDPFLWRGAFGKRVFSTYGNPNFFGNFLVLILPIAVARFLKTKSIILLPLIFLDLLCMYATETKGAWLGFGVTFFIFCVFYGYFFLRERLKISKVKFFILSSIIPILAFASVIVYSYMRPSSISFRVATWLSTWEIVETHPLIGIGVGSFKIIYPAYRRPIIFHIEGRHNTETDHAEQEHLEQVMDNGILGGGIYFWIIAFVTIAGLRALSAMTVDLNGKRAPPEAYDILGYLTAFLGMLAHNCTDVSMRFVSSGIFLGLLPGVILNLARGYGLWEIHYANDNVKKNLQSKNSIVVEKKDKLYEISLWIVRIVCILSVLYFAVTIFGEFKDLQGELVYSKSAERLQWQISWICMVAVVVAGTWIYISAMLRGRSLLMPFVLAVSLVPSYYFWGWFKGDVYHNMAIFFSKQGKWEEAISYYRKVNSFNKYFIMPYYFTANVFNDRFDMNTSYRPELGDTDQKPRNDFERAMDSYNKVAAFAPNYVQMHNQIGLLYLRLANYHSSVGNKSESEKDLKLALESFNKYEKLDPVYEQNYFRKADIYMRLKDFKAAIREYQNSINAWKCFQKNHKHESPEAYFNLGNAFFMDGQYSEALENYKKVEQLNPNFKYLRENMTVVQKMIKAKK